MNATDSGNNRGSSSPVITASDGSSRRGSGALSSAWGDVALVASVILVAASIRLRFVGLTHIGSDSLGPYWRAWRILVGQTLVPTPHVPESGYGLYYTLLPVVAISDSLLELFQNTFLLSAMVCVPVYIAAAARPVTPPHAPCDGDATLRLALARMAGLTASLWIAFSPELCDTAISGARTYQASLWSAIAAMGLMWLLTGRSAGVWILLPALPIAAMNHPLAAALMLPTLALFPTFFRVSGWRTTAGASLLAGMIAAPRVYQLLAGFLEQGSAHARTLIAVASANSLQEGYWAQLERSIRDAFFHESNSHSALAINALIVLAPSLVTLVAVVKYLSYKWTRQETGGAKLDLGPTLTFGAWTAASVACLVAMATAIHYVQHYHFRILLPALAICGARAISALVGGVVQASRRWTGPRLERPLVPLLPLLGLGMGLAYEQTGILTSLESYTGDQVTALRSMSSWSNRIREDSDGAPMIVDAIHLDTFMVFSPAAIVLDQILSGAPRTTFPTHPRDMETAAVYVFVVADERLIPRIETFLRSQWAGARYMAQTDGVRIHDESVGSVVLLKLEHVAAARAWSRGLCAVLPRDTRVETGTAYDYMAPMDPEFGLGYLGAWYDECLLTWGRK